MKKAFLVIPILLLIAGTAFGAQVVNFDGSSWPNARAVVKIDKNIKNPRFSLDIYDKMFDGNVSKIEDLGNPVNVVFLVDVSQSVGYNLKELKPVLAQIAGCFSANDTFSLMTFFKESSTIIKFSTNPAEPALKMGSLYAEEKDSNIYDALMDADQLLSTQPDRKGLIFLFSDGDDTGSQNTSKLPNYPIITVAPPANVKTYVLGEMSKQTGGISLYSATFDNAKVKEFVDNYKDWKNATYSIDFSNLPEIGSGTKKLKLIIDDGKTQESLPVSVTIEGKPSFLWVWILIGFVVAGAIIIWLWSLKKTSVPKGKTVVEKPAEDMHYLAWISLAGDDEHQFRIRKNHVLIGTDPLADFYVDDPTVSVKHAYIIEKADGFYISDCDSVSGTFLNKKRVLEQLKLSDGDVIKVGDTDLQFTQSDFAYVSKKKVI